MSRKLLVLIEVAEENATMIEAATGRESLPDYVQMILNNNFNFDGIDYLRIDVEDDGGVTREGILSDIMHVATPQPEAGLPAAPPGGLRP